MENTAEVCSHVVRWYEPQKSDITRPRTKDRKRWPPRGILHSFPLLFQLSFLRPSQELKQSLHNCSRLSSKVDKKFGVSRK